MQKFYFVLILLVSGLTLNTEAQNTQSSVRDTVRNTFSLKERARLGINSGRNPFYPFPTNMNRDVQYDVRTNRYIIREMVGDRVLSVPQYLTVAEYQRLITSELKEQNWRLFSNTEIEDVRSAGALPVIKVNSKAFEKMFGSSEINLRPIGEASLTFLGRINKNENPLFNERQRTQGGFDFNQRIQMQLVGNIGTKLKLNLNYNTEAQFDFENQFKLDYTGGEDDIIKKIEAGNVSLPLNTTLISGPQALFGLKTQLQFGKLSVSSVFSQQRSQTREIKIDNGVQQKDFRIEGDNYEANKNYFLAQFFRDNFNKALSNPPIINSGVQISKIEVWITNKSGNNQESRDILAFLDLGENKPYNTAQITGGGGYSNIPAGFNSTRFTQQSNNLLQNLAISAPNARFTNSNDIATYFQSNGGTDNYAKVTYARKLTEREFVFQPQLGYITLMSPLDGDEVLAVSYRYTYNGIEYQVGEFSSDVPFDAATPKVLFAKLLKNETIKVNLPTWKLMMKNIYSLNDYQISSQNFRLNVFRLDDQTGIERPLILEGDQTKHKLWIELTGLDRLNVQKELKPDGIFDFEAENKPFNPILITPQNNYGAADNILNTANGNINPNVNNNVTNGYITIDPLNGRLIFPTVEPFGRDLETKFNSITEQELIDRYTFKELYDSTKVNAQQLFTRKNKYVIKGTSQSDFASEISLNSFNVTQGSVRVFSGTIPLTEGVDYTVNYSMGSVKIINPALVTSGQPIRISTENNDSFGMQQRSLFGTRLDYRVNSKLNLGGTIMNLTEKPLTAKANYGEEPISNTMWGLDFNYSSPSRFLTKLVDKLPFISTKEPSSISFGGEFAQLIPGHPSVLNTGGRKGGVSYIDDFEGTRSVIDLKSANAWQLSGTPQMFPESSLINDLAGGYNRAKMALYNIDPLFYNGGSGLVPDNIRNNRVELSNHYVRQIIEQEVFPFKETALAQNLPLPTLDVAYYPFLRGPYNFTTTGFQSNGNLLNPRQRWGGYMRGIQANDFEAINIGYIEAWIMDPFIYKPNSQGGDLYFNLGNISEDILKDGRKALENALPANGDPTKYDETNWGRVTKLQPIIPAFDNDPNARRAQDVGLDGLSDADERIKFSNVINQIKSILNPTAAQEFEADPASDNYRYFRGAFLDNINAGILKRYENYNGPEGNSKTAQQSLEELGIENSASTALPDGEDVNRDNNMSQSDEYFQYKVSLRPGDLEVGKNFISDKVTSQVRLANGQTQAVTWYQIRIPINEYQSKVGGIQDFKSIRFFRFFMTNFADTAVVRFAKLQLVRGDWRLYNAKNESKELIVDPSLMPASPDNSTLDIATVNIEENGKRSPIPYVLPPGIERERDFTNYRNETRQNEQSLSLAVHNLRDGYGRATYKIGMNDLRSYKKLEMYVHLEAFQNNLQNGDLHAFIRLGADNQDNYYEYSIPLKVTQPGSVNPASVWPDENRLELELELLQKAKTARNAATVSGGMPWPINQPFVYTSEGKSVIVKGQPDLSAVRVIMLGLKNPLRNQASPGNDDGMDKSGLAWFNELRLTEFDERGGWAATARMSAKLADFGDFNISGSKYTIGFGSIEKRVSERLRSDDVFFDISSNMELGKFLPKKSLIKIPFFMSYSNQIRTPQFDPRSQDIELKNALNNASRAGRDSILNYAQDFTTRRSINFTNVRKDRSPDQPVKLWDVENFNLSYGSTNYIHRDFIIESNVQRTYRGSIAYNFNSTAKSYEPFSKLKSNMLSILKDVNFTLRPNSIFFRVDLDRYFSENNLRNNDPNNFIPINTTYNKNFLMTRVYGIGWLLTNSLRLNIDATNYSIIDEPEGRINGLKRDTVWQNLKTLGRTTDYNHSLNIDYTLPINKLPGLDWINVVTRYGTNFTWQTEPMSTRSNPNINLGNTIQNSRIIQLNPELKLENLYSKFGFIRKTKQIDSVGSKFSKALVNLLTSVRSVEAAFTENSGLFLPGYLPNTNYFGIENATGAPGWGFVLGSQQDIRLRALQNGWLSQDTLQNQLYINTNRRDLSLSSIVEPINDLRITVFANKNENFNYSTNFRYSQVEGAFRNLTPITTGDYSVSFISLGSAFGDFKNSNVSKFYNKFMENREMISRRLGAENPNSLGENPDGFFDGYDKNSQDVIIPAFIAAYTGKDANKVKLNSMPKFPLPNWRLNYTGLNKIPFVAERLDDIVLSHGYRSTFSVNGFNSLIRYEELGGYSSSRDDNDNFLPLYQFNQVTINEQFSPLIGVSTKFKGNLSANFEINRTRLLGLSLANTQMAQLTENNLVVGLGYITNNFRFPFGLFKQLKLNNTLDFKLDVSVRDNKTVIYRPDILEADVSAGNKNIALRPSIDYVLNQRFNVRVFYDSNITKPYTSQSFNTSYSNFGFSLRMVFN